MPKQQFGRWGPYRCPIPGCKNGLTEDGLVCTPHGVKIWAHIDSVRSKSGFKDPVVRATHEEVLERQRKRALAATRSEGVIYFVELDDKIKIGWTSNLDQRLKAYPPHAQLLHYHPATRADERDLHRSLKLSLVVGREWYSKTPQVMECMREFEEAERVRVNQMFDAKRAQERADREALPRMLKPPAPPPKPRPLTGGALVRAIIRGEVE